MHRVFSFLRSGLSQHSLVLPSLAGVFSSLLVETVLFSTWPSASTLDAGGRQLHRIPPSNQRGLFCLAAKGGRIYKRCSPP